MLVSLFSIGGVIRIRCELVEADAKQPTKDNLAKIKTKICDYLTDSSTLSWVQRRSLAKSLTELRSNLVHLIAAIGSTNEIHVFFLCETFRSIICLKEMVVNGNLENILKELFISVLKINSIHPRVIQDWIEYNKRIQEARKTSKCNFLLFYNR